MPAFVRLAATKLAARSTSGLFSGNVLMLGMRRNSFNSSSRRCSFCCTKLSVACDMGDDSIIEADAPGPFTYLLLYKKGEKDFDFTNLKPFRHAHDAIGLMYFNKTPLTFRYVDGQFQKMLSPSDEELEQ